MKSFWSETLAATLFIALVLIMIFGIKYTYVVEHRSEEFLGPPDTTVVTIPGWKGMIN